MDILLLIACYGAYGAFLLRTIVHALAWWTGVRSGPGAAGGGRWAASTLCGALADLLFFTRLLRSNGLLWALEWLFHASLLLVFLRHLRFVLDPVPACVRAFQPWGIAAGYLLPLVIALILLVRLGTRHEVYSSRSNLLLLGALFVISLSGALMRAYGGTDLVAVKEFTMGLVTFAPGRWPGGALVTLHVVLFLVILPVLPTHIFSAPATIVAARQREDALEEVLRGR